MSHEQSSKESMGVTSSSPDAGLAPATPSSPVVTSSAPSQPKPKTKSTPKSKKPAKPTTTTTTKPGKINWAGVNGPENSTTVDGEVQWEIERIASAEGDNLLVRWKGWKGFWEEPRAVIAEGAPDLLKAFDARKPVGRPPGSGAAKKPKTTTAPRKMAKKAAPASPKKKKTAIAAAVASPKKSPAKMLVNSAAAKPVGVTKKTAAKKTAAKKTAGRLKKS